MNNTTKMSFNINTAHALMISARFLLLNMDDDGATRNPNKYAFILIAAASLESMLNSGVVDWAYKTFSRDNYKRHASAILGCSLRGKLDCIGYLLPVIWRGEDN